MNPTRPSFVCASCARSLRRITKPHHQQQQIALRTATSLSRSNGTDPESQQQLPRWRETPARMKMPVRLRPQPAQPTWTVNNDEERLNKVYDNFLGGLETGIRGRELLTEEVKWLAITHKSYDHGRQGFNDRLAYLGKRIVDLQTSFALLAAPSAPQQNNAEPIFRHPSLSNLENVSSFNKLAVLDTRRLGTLAAQYELDTIVRWKPKRSDNLRASGVDLIMSHTLYSVVGAVAMQKGGEIAARLAREKILRPLGLR